MMPGMDGGEVAARLQSIPRLRNIPIVFITAAVKRQEIASHGGTLGGVPYVAKPVDFQEVMDCIDQTCKQAQPRE
jgi:CheY-like chemotaxis protein